MAREDPADVVELDALVFRVAGIADVVLVDVLGAVGSRVRIGAEGKALGRTDVEPSTVGRQGQGGWVSARRNEPDDAGLAARRVDYGHTVVAGIGDVEARTVLGDRECRRRRPCRRAAGNGGCGWSRPPSGPYDRDGVHPGVCDEEPSIFGIRERTWLRADRDGLDGLERTGREQSHRAVAPIGDCHRPAVGRDRHSVRSVARLRAELRPCRSRGSSQEPYRFGS